MLKSLGWKYPFLSWRCGGGGGSTIADVPVVVVNLDEGIDFDG
ncbi:MAG: hypothetical protein R2851_04875 [Caldilineaceae bacterium]